MAQDHGGWPHAVPAQRAYTGAQRITEALLNGRAEVLPEKLYVPEEVGMKFDEGKLRYDLVPPAALEGLVRIVTFGSIKYGPENWKLVEGARRRYFAAMMRHGWKWFSGEKNDPESGMPHLWHLITNAAFLAQLEHEDKL